MAITVSTWLALVRRTVSGSAAREQTWIMADLFAAIIAGAVGWAKRSLTVVPDKRSEAER
ncbi:hypothetical protein BwDG23_08280 [Bradyrhizobium ottawaense]|nr:hypothetical protein TM102_58600 [Bradyrhizobium sp. TM102]GMO16280.1 hypothetical protein BwSF12_01340 [Bradyrhizobium ottawaense]GMO39945.1 hypothetical protein BwSH14_50650 [Bradyrhizobium ottawaense]GMO60929.1 hypothetical protein BwSG10_08280 [Bradyrhizobium ottawaense]GMO64345.1 hypothetical protein BwSG20_23050 [Bradyrhizobium ottawaense]